LNQASSLHTAAQQGFSNEAQAYSRGRPEYPQGLQAWLRDALGLGPGCQAVDLGAGTGKFTRLLVNSGASVVAVEPVDAMRAQLQKALPGIEALAGQAEAMPLPTASADVLVCAQAFHWFANAQALAEIHRVLRPGAKLGLVWNVRDESCDWVRAITEIITPYEGDAPRFYKGEWRRPFEGAAFTALQLSTFDHAHQGSPQEVIIDRFLSVSFIAALPPGQKSHVESQLRTLIDTHPALRGREHLTFPYRTEAYLAGRLGA